MLPRFRSLLLASSWLLAATPVARAGLEVTAIGAEYVPDPERVPVAQPVADPDGSTSVRNEVPLVWKAEGYFQRNRDLGQVFTPPVTFRLDAIVLRTGPSDAAVLGGAPGAKVFVQLFEVLGSPRIHDNGTPAGARSKHGFSSNHRCDDFLEGVSYRPLRLIAGGEFPDVAPSRGAAGDAGEQASKLLYLRWAFTGGDRLTLEGGKRYAFLVGFVEPGRQRSFTLANANAAAVAAPPSLTDATDRYPGGWSVRREGSGALPPTRTGSPAPPTSRFTRSRLERESCFPRGAARYRLSPTTDGYPDVDTYRDLEFYLEVSRP